MEDIENYKGYLIAAHPKRSDPTSKKGVFLVIDNDYSGSIAIQINKPLTTSMNLAGVMNSVGITYSGNTPIYFGGRENTNRIIVIHSNDWSSPATTTIAEGVRISNDISVLAAIASKSGPKRFRAVAGFVRWFPGHLEGEILGDPPWNDVSTGWSVMPANPDIVFDLEGADQWHTVIEESARAQIDTWF